MKSKSAGSAPLALVEYQDRACAANQFRGAETAVDQLRFGFFGEIGGVLAAVKKSHREISFGETDEASDSTIVHQLSVWRQAQPADSFVKLSSTRLDVEQELEVKLNGFSRYAIAY